MLADRQWVITDFGEKWLEDVESGEIGGLNSSRYIVVKSLQIGGKQYALDISLHTELSTSMVSSLLELARKSGIAVPVEEYEYYEGMIGEGTISYPEKHPIKPERERKTLVELADFEYGEDDPEYEEWSKIHVRN